MKRWLFAIVIALWLLAPGALAEGVNRALLIGCDRFVTQPSTAPSSENNVTHMAVALSGGAMNLERLVTRRNDVTGSEQLWQVIQSAFGDATEEDVSYFYISTHGLWEQGQPNAAMTLLLSDGVTEGGVTAAELRDMFDRIPGMKVLIIDACHSGAMIGKGVYAPFENIFAGGNYKVICSSGGAEESWFWSGKVTEHRLAGAGYFSDALVLGISAAGGFRADENRDGVITLTELKRCLRDDHGASTVQIYPEEDDFAVMTYAADSYSPMRQGSAVDHVTFSDDVLSPENPAVNFSFAVLRPTQVAYQIVYQRDGSWDFDGARLLYDDSERFGAYGDRPGYLSPGMKERTLSLQRETEDSYGYVLVQMLTINSGVPSVAASKVLCVPPVAGDPQLSVAAQAFFCPELGDELCFVVSHAIPCELTVTVETLEGETVCRLASRRPSRPEQLSPRGSSFVWMGQLSRGGAAPQGEYRIRVKAYVGDEKYEVLSEPVLLLSPAG